VKIRVIALCALLAVCVAACDPAHHQPRNAEQVAAQLGATGFQSRTGGASAGVQTGGIAMLHGQRIGIDTFASTAGRNAWLNVTKSYGVHPSAEGTTWVAYPSVAGG
jgi:hypothetical protein